MTYTGNVPGGVSMGGTADLTDALSHFHYGGSLYNGFPAATVTAEGSARAGIDKVHADPR
jgi:hypothetical protein